MLKNKVVYPLLNERVVGNGKKKKRTAQLRTVL
jgi:hypothetical protein